MKAARLFYLLVIVFLLGCVGGQVDVTTAIKLLPEVESFLDEHPNADIKASLWSKKSVSENIEEIREACGGPVEEKDLWKVTITEGERDVVVWYDHTLKTPVCIIKEGVLVTAPTATLETLIGSSKTGFQGVDLVDWEVDADTDAIRVLLENRAGADIKIKGRTILDFVQPRIVPGQVEGTLNEGFDFILREGQRDTKFRTVFSKALSPNFYAGQQYNIELTFEYERLDIPGSSLTSAGRISGIAQGRVPLYTLPADVIMGVGDVIRVDSKTVEVTSIGQSSAAVKVGSDTKFIGDGKTETVGGLKITVPSGGITYTEGAEGRSVRLLIDAAETTATTQASAQYILSEAYANQLPKKAASVSGGGKSGLDVVIIDSIGQSSVSITLGHETKFISAGQTVTISGLQITVPSDGITYNTDEKLRIVRLLFPTGPQVHSTDLYLGEYLIVDGKKVEVTSIGQSSAAVKAGSDTKFIGDGKTETVGGLKIMVSSGGIYYVEDSSSRYVRLIFNQ